MSSPTISEETTISDTFDLDSEEAQELVKALLLFFQSKIDKRIEESYTHSPVIEEYQKSHRFWKYTHDPECILSLLVFLRDSRDTDEFLSRFLKKTGFLSFLFLQQIEEQLSEFFKMNESLLHGFNLKNTEFINQNLDSLTEEDLQTIKETLLLQVEHAKTVPLHLSLDVYKNLKLTQEELLQLIQVSRLEPHFVTLLSSEPLTISDPNYFLNPDALEYLLKENKYPRKEIIPLLKPDFLSLEGEKLLNSYWRFPDEIQEKEYAKIIIDVWKNYGPVTALHCIFAED